MRARALNQFASSTAVGIALVGCSGGSTGPADPPDSTPTEYDLHLALENIYVTGDCENTPGNPGEFAYEIRIDFPGKAGPKYTTSGFPGASGAVTYHEKQDYDLAANLLLEGIPADRRNNARLRFSVIEWDNGADRDPRMNYEQEDVPIPFRSPDAQKRAVNITVGHLSECSLSLLTIPTWSVAK